MSPAVEALTRFLTELPVGDHVAQEPRRLEARAERRGQVLGDAEANVETDQIGQAQWAHWMVVAELHGPIDVFGRGDALLQHADGFEPDGDAEAGSREARAVAHDDGLLSHRLCHRTNVVHPGIVNAPTAPDL